MGQPDSLNATDRLPSKPAGLAPGTAEASDRLSSEAHSTSTATRIEQAACNLAGNLTAGTSGALIFGLLSAEGPWGKALSLPLAFAAGAVTNYGVKGGLESMLLDKQERTLNSSDLVLGGLAGLAGISATAVDQNLSISLARSLGRRELGATVSADVAETAGRQLIKDNALTAVQVNFMRGVLAGGAGSLTYSLPGEIYQNWSSIKRDPGGSMAPLLKSAAIDTAIGAATGGLLGAGATALSRSPELAGRARAALAGDNNVLQMRELSINDPHSNLENWPKVATAVEQRSADAADKGLYSEFDVAGDTTSGHVNYSFTNHGQVENETLASMGIKNIIPGNHEYDGEAGRFYPERYPPIMAPILAEHPNMSLLSANLDVSHYPQYESLVKPYSIEEVPGPDGPVKIATIGLTTPDGAVGEIKYNDHVQAAINTIKELNAQGITHIKLLTHVGMAEDQRLARAILDNDLVVAKITGGHSHTLTAAPVWISNKSTLGEKLQFWKPKIEIPITQTGSSAHYLGETDLAFKASGAADRWHTRSTIIPLDTVEPNAGMQASIEAKTAGLEQLKAQSFDAQAISEYSSENLRNRETPLGNLIADAILSGTQRAFPEEGPAIALVHAGGVRAGLPAGRTITRLDLSNTILNAGKIEAEQSELAMVDLTGKQIQNTLEYALRDLPAPAKAGWKGRLAALFGKDSPAPADEPGNFAQVSGLKYSFDLSKEPWQPGRITGVQVKGADGTYQPIDPNGTYKVVARFHPLEKFWRYRLFGDQSSTAGSNAASMEQALNLKPVSISQVDLLGDYIRGKTIDPSEFAALEGRITNQTENAQVKPIKPTPFVIAPATGTALEAQNQRQR